MNALSPKHDSSPLADRQVVTASDLVRHFGIWQDVATRTPLYILHRGRPRYVLTSIEVMNALCAPHARPPGAIDDGLPDALLDFIDDLLLLVDPALCVVAISRGARSFFGGDARPGATLEQLVAPGCAPSLADAARRVASGGTAETIELTPSRYPERRLSARLAPCAQGVAIKLLNASLADEIADERAWRQGTEEAIAAVGGIASATINLRGYFNAASDSLSAMTGLMGQSLSGTRLTALVERASRAALEAAIDKVLTGRGPVGLTASLLVDRRKPLPVRLGLGAIRRGAVITGAVVAIARDSGVFRDA